MADSEFKIQIVSDADLKGFQQASEASNRLKVDTSDLSDTTKRSLGLLEPLKDEAKNLGGAAEKMGEGMEVSKREARELGNELGKLVGVGGLGRASIGGVGTAAFAAAIALEFLKTTWEDMQEAAKGPLDIQVKDDTAAKVEAIASAYSTFADALKKTREAQSSPEATAQRDITALQTKLKLLQDILKAEEQEALANLAAHKDQMSPQAYAAAESQIKARFAGKESNAGFDERQKEIDRKKEEAAALEKKSAEEKAKGESAANHGGTFATVEKNADQARSKVDEIEANIAMLKRYQKSQAGGDVPEYMGATGMVQQAQEWWKLQKMAGRDQDAGDVQKNLELQLAQAQAEISRGVIAKRQEESGKQATSDAVKDQGDSEKLRTQVADLQAQLDAERQNKAVTTALGEAGSAIGQEHAAEGNNTPQGIADAQAAHQAAAKAVTDLRGALKGVTDTHSEAYAAIMTAIANLRAEDQKLSARLSQMHINGK